MRELTMNLNTEIRIPLYEQIYNYIKQEIQEGEIPCGEKLPSTRALASHLQVSRSTVDLAYEQLRSEGYVETVPCKGYYVCALEGIYRLHRAAQSRPSAGPQVSKQKECLVDMNVNAIDMEHFPYRIWNRITRQVLREEHRDLFLLGDPMGEYGLREAIAGYLHQARGVRCVPEQILIGAGNDYLMMLLGQLFPRGTAVAMETPTYRQAYRVLESAGFSMCTVPMDRAGMAVEGLAASGADLAYVMPSHQYPTGIVMPVNRRTQLLRWAQEREGRYLIEDDHDSEFRYVGKPIPALQGFDRQENVIYLGTFSKSIAPAIRISYLVLPDPLLKVYQKNASFYSSTVSRIDQRVLEGFLKEGYFERHLNKMRAVYKAKHDLLMESMKEFQSVLHIRGEHAGVHLLAEFQNGWTETEVIERARCEGVRVYGLSEYDVPKACADDRPATVLLGYAPLGERQIQESVERLRNAWLT